MVNRRSTLIFLLTLAALSLFLCYLLFKPFVFPLLSATVIGIVFYPLHSRVQRYIQRPSLAALVTTLLVILIFVAPAALVGLGLKREVANLYAILDQKSSESGGFSAFLSGLMYRPMEWIGRYVDVSQVDARAELVKRLQDLSAVLVSQGWNIVGGLGSFVVNSVITLFTLFFLFREGRALRRRIGALLPLSSEQVERLLGGIEDTVVGTVYGGLIVAAVQGALVGIALWILGVDSPLFWGLVAAVFALLPLVGTAIVWVPAAIYLVASGSWVKALILVGWGALVVGTVDNILRPILIRGRVQMHPLLVFFAVFGGVSVFGFLGLFIGPVILALTVTTLAMLREESRAWKAAPAGEASVVEIHLPEGAASQKNPHEIP
ncbi:MAG TPA: AI-2E family transporter [Blastocatellia bacterium]|nr:AI-2E family transporter [Blastocatellia bacterium]